MTETDSGITRGYRDYNEKLWGEKEIELKVIEVITKSYRSHNEKL